MTTKQPITHSLLTAKPQDPEVNRLGASGFRKKEKSKKDQGKEQVRA